MITIDIGKEANKSFHPLFKNKSRFLLLRGGAGSGKSYFVVQKWLYRCLTDGIKHRILVLRKTQNAVYKSCQLVFQKWLDEWKIPYVATYLRIVFDGHTIMFSGLDDPLKIKSIEGITGIWMEEATEFNYRDFSQLNLRIRGEIGTYKQIILSFNPEGGKTSWIYKEFFDVEDSDRDFTSHHSTWRNNAFIDEEYKNELVNEKSETLKKIYDLGEWAELANAIYYDYSKVSVNVSSVLRVASKIYGGIDFGFNDPSVFLLIAEHDSNVYILKELYKRSLTNAEFIIEIKKLLGGIKIDVNEGKEDLIDLMNIAMYADSAEPARIKEFKQEGLRCSPANKKVIDGIDEVRRHHIVINSECLNSCKEIPQYCYQENKDGDILEEPNKSHDHTCDAVRYGVYTSKKTGVIFYG